MAETVTFTGMVLIASPMKEYDKRIEVLTKERGRISAFARGARKPNSVLSACTVPFTFGKFTFYEGRNAYDLVSSEIDTYFEEITADYDALCYASYFSEMIQYFSREGIEAAEELILMYVTMRALKHRLIPFSLIRVIFEMRLMMIEGESIEVFGCLRCGNKETYSVYLSEGGLICTKCAAKEKKFANEYPLKLGADAKYTLQYILTSPMEKLYAFTVTDKVLEELKRFMKSYLARYLPHKFKTLDFIV